MNIKNEILKDMPNDLNDLEKARYIYLKLALLFNFSTKLNNTSSEEFVKMYDEKINQNNIKSNQIICKYWAPIYSDLLSSIGINNVVQNSGHAYVIFLYDNKLWSADATSGEYTDLAKIRYGEKTDNFGISTSQRLTKPMPYINRIKTEDYSLDEIDKKFDFYQERKEKLNKIKVELKKIQDSSISVVNKMDLMFDLIGTLLDGYYEAKDYVRNLEWLTLKEDELEKVHAVELKRTTKDKEVDIIQCIYVNDNDNYTYYLLSPNLKVKKVTKEEIESLEIIGYGLEDKEIPGVNYKRKFKRGVTSKKSFKYRFLKGSLPEGINIYDVHQNKRFN